MKDNNGNGKQNNGKTNIKILKQKKLKNLEGIITFQSTAYLNLIKYLNNGKKGQYSIIYEVKNTGSGIVMTSQNMELITNKYNQLIRDYNSNKIKVVIQGNHTYNKTFVLQQLNKI